MERRIYQRMVIHTDINMKPNHYICVVNYVNVKNKNKMKNNKYLEQAKEVYQLATDLWYKLISDQKRGGGHPGPMGNASNEEDDKIISLLGGATGALKDVSQQKDNELEKALEWWGTIPNSYNDEDQVIPNRRQLLVKYFPKDGATRAIPSTDILTMYQGEMENQDPLKIMYKKLRIEELTSTAIKNGISIVFVDKHTGSFANPGICGYDTKVFLYHNDSWDDIITKLQETIRKIKESKQIQEAYNFTRQAYENITNGM
jgi:hypothetical protein